MPSCTDAAKRALCCLIKNPKREITYAWIVSLILVFVAFIVACIAASKMSQTAADKSSGFTAVWTALLLVLISVIGTVIMRRYQTPLAIGFLLGIIFVMVQQMLIVFAFFAEQAQDPTNSPALTMSQEAMAVFAFFIFLIYAGFGSMLAVFRDDIIKEIVPSADPNAEFDDKNIPADEETDPNQI
jgi:lysylphosphatidylglycerol synthetase-like protein (DUF2156 family)